VISGRRIFLGRGFSSRSVSTKISSQVSTPHEGGGKYPTMGYHGYFNKFHNGRKISNYWVTRVMRGWGQVSTPRISTNFTMEGKYPTIGHGLFICEKIWEIK
jgi:hypothetical protein